MELFPVLRRDQQVTESGLFIQDVIKGWGREVRATVKKASGGKSHFLFPCYATPSPFNESVTHWLL